MTITTVLAVAPVTDHGRAVAWYERLLGRGPDARPMEGLADWHLTEGGWIQVFADAARAGRTALNVVVDDFEAACRTLADRGFDTAETVTTPGGVQLLYLTDPDGNAVAVIANPAT